MDSASRPIDSIADNRYFCHSCDAEIGSVADDFTCPTCHLGFIEKVEEQQTPEELDDDELVFSNAHFMVNGILGDGELAGRRRSNIRRRRFTTRGPHLMTLQPGRGPRRSSGGTIENLVEDVIVNFADYARSGGSPVSRFLLGNPGDYVWGRDGLDSIVSQLLNQIDGAGPPPLTKEKIQEIPTAVISQEHLDLKLQCSVCWEDFTIDEKVMKLACDHMFHKDCIIPWLELHGTCPICRKYLADDGLSSMNSDPLGISLGVGPNLAALIRARSNPRTNTDPVWGMNDYDMASTSSDWPTQLGISLPLPLVSSSSATQTPAAASGMSTYSSVTARNLRDQRLSTSTADVEPMETDHDQNLPAVNNANNS
ncbi:E3 ubiquitin-protein ligase RNF126-like isoform X1 [Rhopalosiphum maidis]|uniref:E3 ubiquitin-protein ligase RNF126-like isoform X1 n=1 Tax=Rhopalosiphum maidis TaxID=43146 RepID=UPI000EFE2A5B|nr:E3 ubiquitin-protein ligase RNF126-like isoform X1 [Rhopalosiphum maidis]